MRILIFIFFVLAWHFINGQSIAEHYQKGFNKILEEDYSNALKSMDLAIELNPKFTEAYYYRGIAKGKLNDHTGAIDDFTMVIRLDNRFFRAFYNRGVAKIRLGKTKPGCKDLKRAHNMGDPDARDFIDKHCD